MDHASDPRSPQLSQLVDCAYRLGMTFGREAEQAETSEERIELAKLFDRCFFSVRVGIALQLRLARTPAPASIRAAASDWEEEDEDEAPDWEERPERYDERERDREREVERASLPVLLRTLESVAADAEALPGPKPADLPTLRELLTHVKSTPAPAPKPTVQGLRTRLAASGAAPALTLSPSMRPKPHLPPPLRRATGPPKR